MTDRKAESIYVLYDIVVVLLSETSNENEIEKSMIRCLYTTVVDIRLLKNKQYEVGERERERESVCRGVVAKGNVLIKKYPKTTITYYAMMNCSKLLCVPIICTVLLQSAACGASIEDTILIRVRYALYEPSYSQYSVHVFI